MDENAKTPEVQTEEALTTAPQAQAVSPVPGNIWGSMEAMKVGKEYKVSATVSVNVKLLRQHLEKAGVIRGLASGF